MEEFAKIIPVKPPMENKKTNPILQSKVGLSFKLDPWRVAIHLKILTPVGTAIIIVAAVK